MPSTRDIRRRIKSVTNIQQITKAMKMVAAARLRRAQERANASRPYAEKMREMLINVAASAGEVVHPLLEIREVKKIGYLVLSADRGLAGSYSSNLIREVLAQTRALDKETFGMITVGRKARDYFKRRDYVIDEAYTGISERPSYQDAAEIARELAARFLDGRYDEIHVVYTRFFSPVNHKPTTIKLLPIGDPGAETNTKQVTEEIIYEPNAKEVLSVLLPKYLETVVYGTLLQSSASELGARMAAMGSATENAQELISQLTLHYNKVRQANITRELTEIVAGAEALS